MRNQNIVAFNVECHTKLLKISLPVEFSCVCARKKFSKEKFVLIVCAVYIFGIWCNTFLLLKKR